MVIKYQVCAYLEHYGFKIPDKSNFNKVLYSLTDLFFYLGLIFKELNLQNACIIGSVPVCRNIRTTKNF
jgi:hypothetical protein